MKLSSIAVFSPERNKKTSISFKKEENQYSLSDLKMFESNLKKDIKFAESFNFDEQKKFTECLIDREIEKKTKGIFLRYCTKEDEIKIRDAYNRELFGKNGRVNYIINNLSMFKMMLLLIQEKISFLSNNVSSPLKKEKPSVDSENEEKMFKSNGVVELKKTYTDAKKVSSAAKTVETGIKYRWNEITEKLDEYTKSHPRKERTRMEWEEIHKMNRELQQLKQEARERNVSLLEKKELEAGSREMEEYIKSRVLPLMSINEATAQDCLEMFVKYGKREVLPDASCSNDPLFNTINQMTQNIISCMKETEVSEKLPLKYLEVMEKYAKRDAVYFRDNDTLLSFIRECGEKLGAGTVERSIEILKGLVYQKRDYTEAKGYVQSLSREVKENEGVKRALRELEEAVKDLPENVPFQPVA